MHSWVTHGSPLSHRDRVQTDIKPLPSVTRQKTMEDQFVNDAVKTSLTNYSRRKPIIPPYNAVKDKYAQAYFESPMVKAIMERNEALEEKHRADKDLAIPGGVWARSKPWKQKDITKQTTRMRQLEGVYGTKSVALTEARNPNKSRKQKTDQEAHRLHLNLKDMERSPSPRELDSSRSFNKLSSRRRILRTPPPQELSRREEKFINDAIVTEKLRTKYKDIIPKYDALDDSMCRGYFGRPEVQDLITTTCSEPPYSRQGKMDDTILGA